MRFRPGFAPRRTHRSGRGAEQSEKSGGFHVNLVVVVCLLPRPEPNRLACTVLDGKMPASFGVPRGCGCSSRLFDDVFLEWVAW